MDSVLLYDPARVRVLALKTAAAIQWLDGRTSSEPMAEPSLAMLRRLSFTLSTTWMPHLSQLLGDTSMITWDSAVPAAPPTSALQGFRSPGTTDDAGRVAAEMVDLAERVRVHDFGALFELDAMLAEHGDDPAVMAEFRRQLGGSGFSALVAQLADGDVFPFGVGDPAGTAARDRVLAALVPMPLQIPSDPHFDLSEAISAGDPIEWFNRTHPGCADIGGPDGEYIGGGFVRGPDGREYPIVVPTVTVGEQVYTGELGPGSGSVVSVNDLNGTDGGWEPVWQQSGIERFQGEPSSADRLLGFLAGTTGAVRPLPPNGGLRFIQVRPDTLPCLASAPNGALPPIGSSDPGAADAVGGAPTAQAVIDLAARGADGWVYATNMDNQYERVYQVIFEQQPGTDLLRARIETYGLGLDAAGNVVVVPEHVWVDDSGNLMSQGICYAPPAGGQGVITDVTPDAFSPGVLPRAYEIHDAEFP